MTDATIPGDGIATFFVPRGAEAAAVRRSNPRSRVLELPAGESAGASLPQSLEEPIVVLGLCGALRGRAVGDVVIYRSVEDASRFVGLDQPFAAALAAALPSAQIVAACSTDHVVTTVRERAELARRHDADVVDMEGSALAVALSMHQLRFAMVRVVSDDASRDLPALERAIAASGRLDIARIAIAFVRRPRAAAAFVRDVRTALRIVTATAGALDRLRLSGSAAPPA